MTVHVPAWKRLGLQLKNEPAASEGSHEAAFAPPPPKRRNLSDDKHSTNDTAATPNGVSEFIKGGLAKTSGSEESLALRDQKAQQTLTERETDGEIAEKQDASSKKEKKKRKSVTFDADTRAVNASVPLTESDTQREIAAEAISELSAQPSPAGEKKEKKQRKKSKTKDVSKVQSEHQSAPDLAETATSPQKPKYLAYLDAYSNDKGNWKFNSNHQKKLLENVFDLHRVPASYDEALVDYVKGLQGGQARIRLREEANGILTKAAEDENGPQGTADGDAAGAPDGSESTEMDKHRTARAKALVDVLQARGSLTDHDKQPNPVFPITSKPSSSRLDGPLAKEPSVSLEPPAGAEKAKKRRSRKNRSATDMPDEEAILSDGSL